MSEIATAVTPAVRLLDAAADGEAAAILARCPSLTSLDHAQAVVAAARDDESCSLLAVVIDDVIVGSYILRRVTMSNEITHLAISPEWERKGLGKMCLYDALFRSGKRPLVIEADDSNHAFFKRCGFKLVGKRKQPDGSFRYRLGWHAPMPKADGSGEVVC